MIGILSFGAIIGGAVLFFIDCWVIELAVKQALIRSDCQLRVDGRQERMNSISRGRRGLFVFLLLHGKLLVLLGGSYLALIEFNLSPSYYVVGCFCGLLFYISFILRKKRAQSV